MWMLSPTSRGWRDPQKLLKEKNENFKNTPINMDNLFTHLQICTLHYLHEKFIRMEGEQNNNVEDVGKSD